MTMWRWAAAAMLAVGTMSAAASARTPDLDDMGRIRIQQMVLEEARNSTVPPALALAVARVESNFQPGAESSAGARGVMQIMPATGRSEYGVQPDELWDARLNIQLGIDFLGRLIERYDGRWDLALSHYNGGSVSGTGAAARPLPATRRYVQLVMQWHDRYDAQQRLWNLADARTDGWRPARTAPKLPADGGFRPERLDDVVPRGEPAGRAMPPVAAANEAGAETVVVEHPRPPRHVRSVVVWRPAAEDDFVRDIELRRQRVRHTLDDFGPRYRLVRW